ncbi:hypothetical protein JOD57_000881 [Geodermatophilus bullaregiensis]|nr:hypothetical protein [Geodermatophilus bullaregiensis]
MSQVHNALTVAASGRPSPPPPGGTAPDAAESQPTPRGCEPGTQPHQWGESRLPGTSRERVGRIPARTRQLTR